MIPARPNYQTGSDTLAKSHWSFRTATELSAALATKQVSAVELARDAIARIERHDGKINAVCVRDFDRGVNTPPPKGGGFGLRLEAGLIDPSGRFGQTTLKLSSGSSGF
jgi:Asp-tRNA(Asn)/Glu-tRNA(Gln) amidotransferase A subunit family amidase